MSNQNSLKFDAPFLRVNPFRGLLIDENTWADAHDYHRNQMRFHLLALHGVGVVQGLQVLAMQPPEMNVVVQPGLAIDAEGRLLLLTQAQTVAIPSAASLTTVYITLQFVETVALQQNVTEGGTPQAARILEECKVEAVLEPVPAAVELARISVQPGVRQIRNATNALIPAPNEIDLTGRTETGGSGGAGGSRISFTVGVLRYGNPDNNEWKRHSEGLRRLINDASAATNIDGNLIEGVTPMDEANLRNCRLLYITGRTAFRYNPEEETALRRFLDRGGILWCEPCRLGLPNGTPDEFSRSCLEMSQRLNRQPIQLKMGHPILNARYLFATPPLALDPMSAVMESNRLVIATGDYGCLWGGRGQERMEPPSRDVIRSAQEFGINVLTLAAQSKQV
jgi:hypothetical protein